MPPKKHTKKPAGPPGTHGPWCRMDPPEVYLRRPACSSQKKPCYGRWNLKKREEHLWGLHKSCTPLDAILIQGCMEQHKNKCRLNTREHLLSVSCGAKVCRFQQKWAGPDEATPTHITQCVAFYMYYYKVIVVLYIWNIYAFIINKSSHFSSEFEFRP